MSSSRLHSLLFLFFCSTVVDLFFLFFFFCRHYLRAEVLQYSTFLLIITVQYLSSSIALCSCSGNVIYFFFNVIYRYTVLKLYSNFHLLQYCTCPLMSCCQNPQINAIMHQHKQLQVITTTLPLQCLHQGRKTIPVQYLFFYYCIIFFFYRIALCLYVLFLF